MRRFYAIFAVALLATAITAPAHALVNYLSINWAGSIQQINFTISGTGTSGADIAQATGHIDHIFDAQNSAGGYFMSPVFCCDVFDYAYASTAANNYEYDVAHYTQADGLTGWATPSDGTDHWRDEGSLTRAAFLANKWGRGSWLATGTGQQRYDKQIALNVAIWKATYGPRFNLTGNGNLSTQQKSYYDLYMVDYNAGYAATQYSWFDSNSFDTEDRYQDFIQPVPEPSSILLLGTGLLGSGFMFRRRRS